MNFRDKKNQGFTLTEIMIAFTIIAMLLVASYFVFFKQIFKAQDGKRKADLHDLTNILEDFYNDTGCYPRPTEICYDAADDSDIPCHICGSEADPLPNFRLPCNPDHPDKKYLYDVEDSECPQWYRVYTELSTPDNSGPCPYGSCGAEGSFGYDYGVSSPNTNLEVSGELIGYEPAGRGTCSNCGSVEDCERQLNRGNISEIYGSEQECCDSHPDADGCVFNGWDGDDCTTCHGSLEICGEELEKIYVDTPWSTWLESCCDDHPTAPSCP
jgi:prepilin-type N-terminal cleavage/methylation domain-containing protein